MFAMMTVLHDGNREILVFNSKEDASGFKDFANAYMAQGGNGYNAYWVYGDAAIVEIELIPEGSTTILNYCFISYMYQSILRLNPGTTVDMKMGITNGTIAFEFSSSAPLKTIATQRSSASG